MVAPVAVAQCYKYEGGEDAIGVRFHGGASSTFLLLLFHPWTATVQMRRTGCTVTHMQEEEDDDEVLSGTNQGKARAGEDSRCMPTN